MCLKSFKTLAVRVVCNIEHSYTPVLNITNIHFSSNSWLSYNRQVGVPNNEIADTQLIINVTHWLHDVQSYCILKMIDQLHIQMFERIEAYNELQEQSEISAHKLDRKRKMNEIYLVIVRLIKWKFLFNTKWYKWTNKWQYFNKVYVMRYNARTYIIGINNSYLHSPGTGIFLCYYCSGNWYLESSLTSLKHSWCHRLKKILSMHVKYKKG